MSVPDRVSFQLYSARKFPPLDSQLATLAKLGYRNVEPYGGLFQNPGELKAGLAEAQARDAHRAYRHRSAARATSTPPPRSPRTSASSCSSFPPCRRRSAPARSRAGRKLGKELAGYQKKLAAHGIGLAWHNHSFEFAKLPDGSYPLDHIFAAAPGLQWQADIGWIQWAGEDPASWIKKYSDRVTLSTSRISRRKAKTPPRTGRRMSAHGVLDWKRLMPAIKAPGVLYLVMEHDNPNDFERFARRSYQTVSAW